MALNAMLMPPPDPQQRDEQAAAQLELDDAAAEQQPAEPATIDRERASQLQDPPADEDAPERPEAPELITLGSMDPASGYWMLVTLNTRGGAIERLELTERNRRGNLRYRRVDTNSGYLGYLSARTPVERDGCLVRVVGPGTPAALAQCDSPDVAGGLQVGDRIVAIGGQAISSRAEMQAVLDKTRPGRSLAIEVLRGQDEPRQLHFTAQLTQHPLDLLRLSSAGGDDEVLGNLDRLSCRVTLSQLNRRGLMVGQSSIEGLEWVAEALYDHQLTQVDHVGTGAAFSLPLTPGSTDSAATGRLRIERSYTLQPGSYLLDMDVAVKNEGSEPQQLSYRLEGPNGMTLEGWWYSTKISPNFLGGAAARDVVYKSVRDGHRLLSGYNLLKRAKKRTSEPDEPIFGDDEPEPHRTLHYIGLDAQYFNVAFLPPADSEVFPPFRRSSATLVAQPELIPAHQERAVNASFFVDSEIADVPPGGQLRGSWRMFAGPKEPEVLAAVGMSQTIEHGWFGGVSKMLGSILHLLNRLSGNYALAIILLTVLVRLCLFPLSRNAAVQAQRMQELAPELKKIAEKYKDDMEGRLRAQRDFQKRVGFNPLAGCLPALLQLPIFIGLYRCLSVDIELRQEPLSRYLQWCNNLAAPDMFYFWGDWLWEYLSGRGTGWLGPYFNILPVFVVALFLLQQKLFMPPPTDEQQKVTQKVMFIMTLMMGLFFFRVAAGLCIYFITSSLWGIAERIIVKRTLPPAKPVPAFEGATVDGKVVDAGQKPAKKKSLAEMIREQVNPEPPKPLPPKKRRRPSGKGR